MNSKHHAKTCTPGSVHTCQDWKPEKYSPVGEWITYAVKCFLVIRHRSCLPKDRNKTGTLFTVRTESSRTAHSWFQVSDSLLKAKL